MDEEHLTAALGKDPQRTMPHLRMVVLPAIVTSARLMMCEFDPLDVQPRTGELVPWDRATLTEHTSLIFGYPVPRHLQRSSDVLKAWERGALDWGSRMHILVIQSAALADTLKSLHTDADVADIEHLRLMAQRGHTS